MHLLLTFEIFGQAFTVIIISVFINTKITIHRAND